MRRFFVACAWVLGCCAPALAQLPASRLYSVFPPGGKQGGEVVVNITGLDLDGANRLIFSHPGITSVQQTTEPTEFQQGLQPLANRFTVTIPADVPIGRYEVRAVGKYGVSNPRSFEVGDLPEVAETEPNNTPKEAAVVPLDTVVCGTADGTTHDQFKFTLAAGQRVVVECRAQQIDSQMDSSLVVFDPAGRELARGGDDLGSDSLVDFTAPVAGEYLVRLHDAIYRGGGEYVYRLVASTRPRIEFVLPPAVTPGAKSSHLVVGRNLPGGQPSARFATDAGPLDELTVEIEAPASIGPTSLATGTPLSPARAGGDGFEYRLVSPQGASNAVSLGFATAPIALEQEPNDEPAGATKVTVPCEVAGQLDPVLDRDLIQFDAKKGEAYWIECLSERLGLPTDPIVVVQQVKLNDQGQEQVSDLRQEDDVAPNIGGPTFSLNTADPSFRFDVPEDGTYRLLLRDQNGVGGPRSVYRLAIRPPQPDFRLVIVEQFPNNNGNQQISVWSPFLRKGGSEAINVLAIRRDGFAGPIAVAAEGLPQGVTAAPAVIGGDKNTTTLVVKAEESAPESQASIKVVGRSTIAGAEIAREARAGSVVWPTNQGSYAGSSRVTADFALSVSGGETEQFTIDTSAGTSLEMSRAGKLDVPIKIVRRAGFAGAVTLNVIDPPPNVQIANITINGDQSEGILTIQLNNNASLGAYSFTLRGDTQVNYSRNPEAAAAAATDKTRIDGIVTERMTMVTQATEAKTAADQAATEAANAAATATANLATADQAATTAATAATAAAEQAKAAADASAAAPDDAALKEAAAAAEKASADAATAAKTAADAKAVAEKAATDAATLSQTKADEQTAATKALEEANARLAAATAAQTAATQRATELQNAANPQALNVFVPAGAFTLKITEAPIGVAELAAPAALKQGAKIEIPIAITRLYGYAEAPTAQLVLPGGVGGLSAEQVTIAADQSQAVLAITATADATLGTHALTVRMTVPYNGQQLQIDKPLSLTIEAAQ